MALFGDPHSPKCDRSEFTDPNKKDSTDIKVQLALSLALGVSAFLAFCILRPRWKSLYAARKRHFDPAIGLPILPDTLFGWMLPLYRITEQQVLASAGLDAYVFLRFFKMSIKLFSIMFFFATVVLLPINNSFPDELPPDGKHNQTSWFPQLAHVLDDPDDPDGNEPDRSFNPNMGYLWAYMTFAYFFTILTFYIMDKETLKVIRVRQDYLGTQSTITDRTFRLSGIPKDLRTEEGIKKLVQKLEIGKVESVTLCRDWTELDQLTEARQRVLRKLEESWGDYLKAKPKTPVDGHAAQGNNGNSRSGDLEDALDDEAGENGRLLTDSISQYLTERERPQARIWYGFLGLQSRKTDAIDYYSERLRRLDEKIHDARKKTFDAADIAFVTMDSIAACQMAIQALIDPYPGRLLTSPAPSPSDVVWKNTYKPYFTRRLQSILVTMFVALLTIIWLVPVGFFASILSICTIQNVLPSLYTFLKTHPIIRALIQTGLPTAAVSLLNIAVPYLYDFLSYQQGMISQGDIALSVISKNFFFTFFNIFLIFTVFTGVNSIYETIRQSFKDTTYIAFTLAQAIKNLSNFYTNFIMLQGLGLFPFRLLEFGSVSLYPINRFLAKTPRDKAEMAEPPMFYYGFYLPTALLVFILCLVYSALPGGYQVLGLGLAYFILGYFTYKYQLVYAMDQPQHATGGAWRLICYRIMLGLIVFQLTMSGYLALRKAFVVALLIVPLLIMTLYYSYSYKRQFEPLTHFISLRSIKRGEGLDEGGSAILDDDEFEGIGERQRELLRRGSTVDEDREKGLRFVNPSLLVPLEQPWIYQDPPPPLSDSASGFNTPSDENQQSYTSDLYDAPDPLSNSIHSHRGNSTTQQSSQSSEPGAQPPRTNSSSSVSLGDTHVWRDG